MNRETELRYAELPQMHKQRSKFKVEFSHLTSFDAADCVPIFCEEILPGDTISLDMSAVVRMSTPLFPTMSNAVLDCFFFFVPTRLVWEHWVNFWGENTNAWYQSIDYSVPQLKTSDMLKFEPKTTADYLGLPSGIGGLSVNALPFRCYVKCWNDWFRDENLQQEAPNVTTDSDAYYDNRYAYLGGALLKANKLHDRFTSSLPQPQKGPSTTLPLGNVAPIYALSDSVPFKNSIYGKTVSSLIWRNIGTSNLDANKMYGIATITNANKSPVTTVAEATETTIEGTETTLSPHNLWADLGQATAATVADLRLAFQVQRYYELLARSGSRYIEWIKAVFGVTSPDARLQRSEYLGGRRIPIEMYQTVQQSSTTETSPLGQTGAFSHTADKTHYFTKSFTEGGYVIGIATIRYYHIYQQGIPRMFKRKKWYDFYIPTFASLSEQPVYVDEIYATGTAADQQVFGYQEAWSEYRMRTNMTSSAMKSTYGTGSLDAWHYGDYYESQPSLSASWIQEDKSVIDRTLALSSDVENQFIGDFYFKGEYVRQMPLYSVPGLIDHL